MGQKTSPIATRLYGNCWPNSCWYSDENIFSLFYQDFNQKQFFDAVMPPSGRKFGFRPASIVCHQFPKKSSIHVFFLRRNRRFKLRGNQRRRVFRFAKNKSRFQSKGLRMPVNKRLSAIDVAAIQHLYANKNMLSPRISPTLFNVLAKRRLKHKKNASLHPPEEKESLNFNKKRQNKRRRKEKARNTTIKALTPFAFKRPYNTHMSELVRLTSGSNALIVPLSLRNMLLSASLIATNIRALLQQNKRFPLICKWLFQDIKKYSAIKGVRISCSGRLNAKAIARTDLRKLGETSLHTFQKQIDYATSTAITRHGVLGIKVWVSYSFKGE